MTLSVPTRLFYDRSASAMGLLGSRADTLQTQVATGKRLATASDDAVAYTRLRGLARDTADAGVSAANLDMAAAVLAQGDTAIAGVTSQIQRAAELAIRARAPTLNAAAREGIAAELDAVVAQLVTLGNTADPRGGALFGGTDGGAGVIANAGGSFTFAQTPADAIPTGDGQSVQANEAATRLFTSPAGDILSTIAGLAAALRTGTDVDATAAAAGNDLAAADIGVNAVRASLGARANRVEVDQATLAQTGIDREAMRAGLEDTDIASAITELQKTMTILSATQASFSKLQALSLFDYLR